jgi:hypothetical protein
MQCFEDRIRECTLRMKLLRSFAFFSLCVQTKLNDTPLCDYQLAETAGYVLQIRNNA